MLDLEETRRNLIAKQQERKTQLDKDFSEMVSYERVASVLEREIETLMSHANFERYGTRDGAHPPMKPEDALNYGQLLTLRIRMALAGVRTEPNDFRITKDQGWVYDPK